MDMISLQSQQFALSAMFHILFPTLSIGLATYLLVVEALWLKTRNLFYYHQARHWAKLFALSFGVGVVSGIPLEFLFGTHFSGFSRATGDFFGHILGFETAMAFMLEAGFLGIMLFGWKRVPPWLHMLATTMVWFGATLSAFWILVANSWMHTPQGVQFIDGRFVVQDWLAAVFTPSLWTRFPHMYLAAIESTLVVLGGVSAWFLLKGRHTDFYRRSFRFALIGLLITAPVQVLVGDASGLVVAEHQPAKLAAIEAHWKTNPEGEGAAWVMLAAPDQAAQKNDWEILVPNLLSLIVTHSPDGQVKGLSEFPRADQPNVPVIFWSFRVMFAIGFALALLAVATAWMAWRRRLWDSPWLLRAWVVATPLGFIATEAGWVTAEVGRQPWVVYGMMRTRDALSTLPDSVLHTSLALYAVIYVLLLGVFLLFSGRVLRTVPDEAEPPVYVKPGHLEISHA